MTQDIKNFPFQQCEKRIEKLSQQDKLSKFCMDAGFLSVVENGQCCMNTLFQEVTDHHIQKDGFRETQKLDPCWKLRPIACVVNTS